MWGIEKLNVPRSDIPAVTHVDYSARIQTVHAETNPGYHRLLTAFEAQTGCAVLVNTSFNVRGEPIVCTPQDAYRCFMRTEMDMLVLMVAPVRQERRLAANSDSEELWGIEKLNVPTILQSQSSDPERSAGGVSWAMHAAPGCKAS